MLPSVTDVVRELAKVVSADPAVLFRGARSVVAEELAKVKQGIEAAPLDVLVKRARLQLERTGEATPVSDPAPPSMPVFPARPGPPKEAPGILSSRASGASMRRPTPDDPFQDVASRAELDWEKEIPIQAEDAPFRSAILPIPHKARGPLEISAPIDAPPRVAPEQKQQPAPAPKPQPELELDFAPQPAPAAPEPLATPAAKPRLEPPEQMPAALTPPPQKPKPERLEQTSAELTPAAPRPRPAPPEPAPEKPLPRPAVASAPAIPLVNPRETEVPESGSGPAASPPSVPKAPGEPLPPPPAGPERFLRAPTPPARHEPAVKSTPRISPLKETREDRDAAAPAMEDFRFKAPERPAPAPVRSSRKGWIAALAGVLAVGATLTWAVREGVFKGGLVRSAAPAAPKKPDVAPAANEAQAESVAPVPTTAPALVAKSTAPAPKAAPVRASGPSSGAAVPKGRAAVLLTPDWAGKPTVYVIHFSSHKDRESAAKEAQKLGAALGAPGHAVEVDLGEKGIWYRVVIGEFKDVDAARAFRADLEAKNTPGMGFVYEMRGR